MPVEDYRRIDRSLALFQLVEARRMLSTELRLAEAPQIRRMLNHRRFDCSGLPGSSTVDSFTLCSCSSRSCARM